jgi:hypothetical protein
VRIASLLLDEACGRYEINEIMILIGRRLQIMVGGETIYKPLATMVSVSHSNDKKLHTYLSFTILELLIQKHNFLPFYYDNCSE